MTRKTRTVAVTGLNANDNPGPGVSVIRSLRLAEDVDYRIIGLAYDPLDPGAYARDIVDEVYMFPYPSQGRDTVLERLLEIHDREDLDAIIPTLDAELPIFISIEQDIATAGIGSFMPTRDQYDLRAKNKLPELCKHAGLRALKSCAISSVEQLDSLPGDLDYPFYVKGLYYGAERAANIDEATRAFYAVTAKWGFPVIIQEAIKGEEVDVVAVGDGKGGLIGALSMKKMYLTDKGKGWSGIAIQNPELLDLTQKFMEFSKWRGPCEMEVIIDREDQLHLIEINPRFPAWVYLSAGAGLNLPHFVASLATGDHVKPSFEYNVGTMFVRIAIDQIAHLADYQQLAAFGYLSSKPETVK